VIDRRPRLLQHERLLEEGDGMTSGVVPPYLRAVPMTAWESDSWPPNPALAHRFRSVRGMRSSVLAAELTAAARAYHVAASTIARLEETARPTAAAIGRDQCNEVNDKPQL
jgi:hypothetical protein